MQNFYQTIFLNIYFVPNVKDSNFSLEPLTALKDANKNDHKRRHDTCHLIAQVKSARVHKPLNPPYSSSLCKRFGHHNHDLKAKMWQTRKMEAHANKNASVYVTVQWDEFSLLPEDLTEEVFPVTHETLSTQPPHCEASQRGHAPGPPWTLSRTQETSYGS